jgi:fibronectin type 3 domain-containing protein
MKIEALESRVHFAAHPVGVSTASTITAVGVVAPKSAELPLLLNTSSDADGINVIWTGGPKAKYYYIYRSTNPKQKVWPIIAVYAASPYRDTNFEYGVTYYYRVTAVTEKGESAPTPILPGVVYELPRPKAPDHFQVRQKGNDVLLIWKDVANEQGYYIQRSEDEFNFKTIGKVRANHTSFTDRPSKSGTYTYRIVSFNEYGSGERQRSWEIAVVFKKRRWWC